jgi:hypothetical protein
MSSMPVANGYDNSIVLFFFLFILMFGGFKALMAFHTPQTDEKVSDNNQRIINPDEGQDALNFLDRIIKEKYNYHLYLILLPIYSDNKIPEKKVINELKEKIYVSVVGSLTHPVKKEILRFFTEKGIELYVHERIVILMNETDFRAVDKFNEAFRDLNKNNIEKILS